MVANSLKTRLKYYGGNQAERMKKDKLRSLKSALKYSYQSATLVTPKRAMYRCLINPDKLKNIYDNKILSIPYEDTKLIPNSYDKIVYDTFGNEPHGLKSGDVFEWWENHTYWIIYLQHLEETAYFRAEIRRCKYEIDVDGKKYKVYIEGPQETKIPWNQKAQTSWNDMNYKLHMYITKDENTLAFFERFKQIKFDNKTWEVQVVDRYDADGCLIVILNEYFNNTIKETMQEIPTVDKIDSRKPHIEGEQFIEPYSTNVYTLKHLPVGGVWQTDSAKLKIISTTDDSVEIYADTGKSGKFNLTYSYDDKEITLPIMVESI